MAVSFSKSNLTSAKIVTTPSPSSWSQAYNAGKLFAVLSLKSENPEELPSPLSSTGKNIIEILEEEFFTLETKDLSSIKKSILNTLEKIPQNIVYSFGACVFVDKTLYVFSKGGVRVTLKRNQKVGEILHTGDGLESLVSSSGILENNDLIIFQTKPLSDIIEKETILSSLDLLQPHEIAESLTPQIHEKEDGGASAIIIKYEENQATPLEEPSEEIVNETEEKAVSLKYSKFNFLSKFSHSKKVFLTIAIIILIILTSSIFFALRKQQDAKISALFEEIYPTALKKYDEGNSLLELNKNLARESFLSAQKIIKDNLDEFPPKSKENRETQDLLKKIDGGLTKASPVDESGLDRSNLSILVQNGSGIEGAAGKAKDALKELGYSQISTGNADNYDYKGINIKVKKSKSDFLNLLKKDLAKDYIITSTSSDLPSNSLSDILIIIGK